MVACRVATAHGGYSSEVVVRRVAKARKLGGCASKDGHGLGRGCNGHGHGGRTCSDGDSSGAFHQLDDPYQHINGLPSQLAINYDPTDGDCVTRLSDSTKKSLCTFLDRKNLLGQVLNLKGELSLADKKNWHSLRT